MEYLFFIYVWIICMTGMVVYLMFGYGSLHHRANAVDDYIETLRILIHDLSERTRAEQQILMQSNDPAMIQNMQRYVGQLAKEVESLKNGQLEALRVITSGGDQRILPYEEVANRIKEELTNQQSLENQRVKDAIINISELLANALYEEGLNGFDDLVDQDVLVAKLIERCQIDIDREEIKTAVIEEAAAEMIDNIEVDQIVDGVVESLSRRATLRFE